MQFIKKYVYIVFTILGIIFVGNNGYIHKNIINVNALASYNKTTMLGNLLNCEEPKENEEISSFLKGLIYYNHDFKNCAVQWWRVGSTKKAQLFLASHALNELSISDFQKAQDTLETFTDLDDNNSLVWYIKGEKQYLLGDFDSAAQSLEKAIVLNDYWEESGISSKDVLATLAMTLLSIQEWENALRISERLIEVDASSLVGYRSAGVASIMLGDSIKAEFYMDVVKQKGGIDDFVVIADALIKSDNAPEAIDWLDALSQQEVANHYYANITYGVAYNDNGEFYLAEQYLRRAIEIRPDYYWAHKLLADVLLEKQQYFNSTNEFCIAKNLGYTFTDIYISIAHASLLSGDKEGAKWALEKLVGNDPHVELDNKMKDILFDENTLPQSPCMKRER